MSIDLNWETVTGGPDGQELAHKIRDFIHDKFQSIPLPRFIKSVTVHDFEFGSIPPELEIKDVTDPLPDFYEENSDIDEDEDFDGEDEAALYSGEDNSDMPDRLRAAAERRRRAEAEHQVGTPQHLPPHINLAGQRGNLSHLQDLGSPFLGVSTPGIPGGTSNLHYFHSHFATGLSGTHTPLAAVASAQHMGNGWLESGYQGQTLAASASTPNLQQLTEANLAGDASRGRFHSRNASQSSISVGDSAPNLNSRKASVAGLTPARPLRTGSVSGSVSGTSAVIGGGEPALKEKHSVSTLAPTSVGTSRPPTRDALAGSAIVEDDEDGAGGNDGAEQSGTHRRFREPRVEDMQAVFRIKYAGDIKLLLTTEILLDYPMPSFVGIPVRLSITGLTFDGVGVVAYIRKRVHFCFLSPEDAHAAVGGDEENRGLGPGESAGGGSNGGQTGKIGGLLQEIRVESEIGQREGGKQSLKNVGKVERFVLDQVRRIFEEEFVYPSFWTFLV